MRLTLRSILAYLDDVLDPSKLKEMGTKISESPAAAATVSRIKEVVRRRRIAAPELTGTGSAPDPNIVAEYLDNTLDPAAIPALEKLCLDSDMHLAEVAASHQILTAVLGEPIDVPATTRERMYSLVSPAPIIHEPPTPLQPPSAGPVPTAPSLLHSSHATIAPEKLPQSSPPFSTDYLRPSGGRRLFGVLFGLMVAIGWLGWVLVDQGLFPMPGAVPTVVDNGPTPSPAREGEEPNGEAAPEPDTTTIEQNDGKLASTVKKQFDSKTEGDRSSQILAQQTAEPSPLTGAIAEQGAETDSGDDTETSSMTSSEQLPPSEEVIPETEIASSSPTEAAMEVGNADSSPPLSDQLASTESSPATRPNDAPPEPPQAPPTEFPSILYSSVEGILLIHQRASDQWNVMPRRAIVNEGDEVAVPDPFEAVLTFDGAPLEITLFGGSRVALRGAIAPDMMTLEINRGRICLRRPVTSDQKKPISVRLKLRGQTAVVTLNEPGTLCGLEVSPRAPQGRSPDPVVLLPEGGLHVVSGDASISWEGGEPVPVGANVGWAAWPVPPQSITVGPTRAIPDWLSPEGVPQTAADKKWFQMYEKEFAIDQPVTMSIPALILDRRERISSFATYTLGVVDDIPSLVKALQSDYEETRLAAIWCLRGWLPSLPANEGILQAEIQRNFPDDEVEQLVDLLWGYSPTDARNPEISKNLITWMDHKDVTIRELAFFHVVRLTGRTNAHGYRPNLLDSPRNAALMGWRNYLERNAGQLLK